jgi:catechol 2,3-dioxygenase-like lactoylglutathione lyase family enzyme
MKLSYVIGFVGGMNRAVKFYRDVLGFQLKFESPGWSEFVTGETKLALHPASQRNPAGAVSVGLHSSRCSRVSQGREREGGAVRTAADETGLRRRAWRSSPIRKADIAASASSSLCHKGNSAYSDYGRQRFRARGAQT